MGLFDQVSTFLKEKVTLENAITKAFSKFDKNKSGYIEKSELLHVLEVVQDMLGMKDQLPAATVDAIFYKAAGKDGKVDETEFNGLVHDLFHKLKHIGEEPAVTPAAPGEAKQSSLLSGDGMMAKLTEYVALPSMLSKPVDLAFQMFDKDKSGFIDCSEVIGVVQKVCTTIGLPSAPTPAINMVFDKVAGTNGRIDRQEFTGLLSKMFTLATEQAKSKLGGAAHA